MIRERYSDQVHSGEFLDVLNLNGTPACLVDLRLQLVMLNQKMQGALQLENAETSFSQWISTFRTSDQSELHKMFHRFLAEQSRESSVHLSHQTSDVIRHCKGVHLSNGQIIITLTPIEYPTSMHQETAEGYRHGSVKEASHEEMPKESSALPARIRKQTLHLSHPKTSQLKYRMSNLVDKFPHGIALLNNTWDVIYANPKMEELTGIPFELNHHKKLWEIHSISQYYSFFQHILRAMETQSTVEFEGFIDQTNCAVKMTVHPTDQGITVFAQDITQYKQHLEALRDSEERFNMVASHIKDVIWIRDLETGEVYYISPSFKNMFGIARREVTNIQDIVKKCVHKEDQDTFFENLDLVTKGRQKFEYRVLHPSGKIKWVRTRGFPLENNGKRYVVGIHEDITELKEIIELKEQSQQLSTITQMSAGIAHEIKNPLTAIKGFLQIGAANPDLRDNYQEIILDEVNRIESIVQDFMMLSKPKSSIQLEEVGPDQAIAYVLRLLEGEAEEKGVKLSSSFDLEGTFLYTEPKRLKQILLNLVKNAIEAVDQGGSVHIAADYSGDNLTVSVSDNGPGLSEDELNRIGEPFFTTKEKGTGLGVMVTKKMVEDLNGKIYFNSKIGHGTLVTVVFTKEENSKK
ncbi:ATP-binding protein [Halobacillus rhizosphaerae]|uniref:ATP-binding protein n=1 Tax=Halobacillus rhizosphaerae TaxID=3064889 RepID=UPI00398A982B